MRNRVLISLLVLLAVLTGCNDKSGGSGKRPNVLFLFADDQRFSTIHALNNSEIITPTLDQLAANSVVFRNAYIWGGLNAAVCAPSRAMLMTGRTMFQINPTNGLDIDPAHKTMPQVLKENGYVTYGIGKWHNGKAAYARSFSAGGKIMFGGMTGSQYNLPLFEFDSTGMYSDENRKPVKDIHSSQVYADAAIEFLNNHDKKKPFFMYVAFQAPHDPRQAPEEYVKMYDTAKISRPENFARQHPFDNGELDVRDEMLAAIPRQVPEVKSHIRDYYAMITHLDHEIGRILEALRQSGEYDNTIIIYSADNGLAVGQHGLMGKQSLYEHSIKVPLFVSVPGIPSREVDDIIFLQDLFPTIASLVDVKVPESVTGYSYKGVLEGKAAGKRSTAAHAYKNFQRAYRKGDWKLILYNVQGEKHQQLFNVKEDPWEMHNVYDENESLVKEMKEELQAALTAAGDSVQLHLPDWGVKEIPSWRKMQQAAKAK